MSVDLLSEAAATCRNCGGGIHLETGDLGFGEVSVWNHDSWRPYGYGDDPEPLHAHG